MSTVADTRLHVAAVEPLTKAEEVLGELMATTDLRAAPEKVKARIAEALQSPSEVHAIIDRQVQALTSPLGWWLMAFRADREKLRATLYEAATERNPGDES